MGICHSALFELVHPRVMSVVYQREKCRTNVPLKLAIIDVALGDPYRQVQFLVAELRERNDAGDGSRLKSKVKQASSIH